MNNLIDKIENLKNSEIGSIIDNRIVEFKEFKKKSNDEIFKELCFCILTANFTAEKSIEIQDKIGECFLTDSKEILAEKLKKSGHRFPNKRASYINESIKCKDNLKKLTETLQGNDLREWIVENFKGIGFKEASHFLRNIGNNDYAIIDFHIIDLLVREKFITRPKTITKKKYLEIEKILQEIGNKTGLTLAELDLYLWYIETGKILK